MIFNMNEADFDDVVRVHLKGHFCMMRHASEYWRTKSKAIDGPVYGRVVNTTSEAALIGGVGQPNYGPAKAGIIALSLIAANSLSRHGVNVNVIAPRARTRMTTAMPSFNVEFEPDGFDPYAPENVTPLVAFLPRRRRRRCRARCSSSRAGCCRCCTARSSSGPSTSTTTGLLTRSPTGSSRSTRSASTSRTATCSRTVRLARPPSPRNDHLGEPMPVKIEPFRVDIPEADLADLHDRLARTRFPEQIPGAEWDYGTELGYLRELRRLLA